MADKVTKSLPRTSVFDHSIARSLLLLFPSVIISFRLMRFDPDWLYFRVSDIDTMMSTQGLMLNSGTPPGFFDHPGDVAIRVLAVWYSFLSALGLLEVSRLDSVHSPADLLSSLFAATVAGRVLSSLIAILCSFLCTYTFFRISKSLFVAVVAGLFFSAGNGVFIQGELIRTEPLPHLLWWISLLIMTVLSRPCSRSSEALLTFLLGAFIYWQVAAKVQSAIMFPFFVVIPFVVFAVDRFQGNREPAAISRHPLALLIQIPLVLSIGAFAADISLIYRFERYHLIYVLFLLSLPLAIRLVSGSLRFCDSLMLLLSGIFFGTFAHVYPFSAYPLYTSVYIPEKLLEMCNLGSCPVLDKEQFMAFVSLAARNLFLTFFLIDKETYPYLITKVGLMISTALFFFAVLGGVAGLLRRRKLILRGEEFPSRLLSVLAVHSVFLGLTVVLTGAMLFRWMTAYLCCYYWHFLEACAVFALLIPLLIAARCRGKLLKVALLSVFLLSGAVSVFSSDKAWREAKAAGLPLNWTPEGGCEWMDFNGRSRDLIKQWGGCEQFYQQLLDADSPSGLLK